MKKIVRNICTALYIRSKTFIWFSFCSREGSIGSGISGKGDGSIGIEIRDSIEGFYRIKKKMLTLNW